MKKRLKWFLLRRLYALLYATGKGAPKHAANGFNLSKFPKPSEIHGENLYNWIGKLSAALVASDP